MTPLEELGLRLRFWAQCLAARFGGPVLLIGSALKEDRPRDVDIRIPIADYEFVTRYQIPIVEWQATDRGSIWIRDMAKLGRQGLRRGQCNLDLQVWPYSTYEWSRPHIVLAGADFLPREGV